MGVYAVTRNDDAAVVYIKNPPNVLGSAYGIFAAVAEAGIDVNMIIQTASAGSEGRGVDIVFVINREDCDDARCALADIFRDSPDTTFRIDCDIAKIIVMGDEMQGKPGVAAKVFRCLWDNGVNIINISASEIGISMLVAQDDAARAMECLLHEFDV